MTENTFIHSHYLFLGFITACALSYLLCPLFRQIAIRYDILDHPNTAVKIHSKATPYLGGAGIGIAFLISFILINKLIFFKPPPFAILLGALIIFFLGVIDDAMKTGLSFKLKFVFQFIIAFMLLPYLQNIFSIPNWIFYSLSFIWIIGIINIINIIDVMDGLAASVAIIACLTFSLIFLPQEIFYLKLFSVLLAGAILGFLPYNFSHTKKMFMGDTGSLFIGYMLAILSVNTQFSTNYAKICAPILILGIPIFDTCFVMLMRYQKGMSPFRGSRDHIAMRLVHIGLTSRQLMTLVIMTSLTLSASAWFITQLQFHLVILACSIIFILFLILGYYLRQIKESP